MKFIQAIQEATTAKIHVFGGAVVFECKILSPMEAEAAGLASSLVASSVLDPNQLKKLARQKEILETVDNEDPTDQELDQLLNLLHGFDVGKMMKIEEHQNKILKQVVTRQVKTMVKLLKKFIWLMKQNNKIRKKIFVDWCDT